MKPFYELRQDETVLGSWTVNYIAPNGGRYLGQLDVTNANLYFDGKFDLSFAGVLEETLFIKSGSAGYMCIPKEMIRSVEARKTFLNKQVRLTLSDGRVHTFDYGAMKIDRLVEQIEAK